MIRKSLIIKLFAGAYMHRWNDKLRPIDFIESDKHGHKMIIAYVLAKCEERLRPIDWIAIIRGGLFEYLQKIVLTDLKSPVFYLIKKDRDKYRRLNEFVYREVYPFVAPLGQPFCDDLCAYLLDESESIERDILGAASALASKWEFDVIARGDPHGFEADQIAQGISQRLVQYDSLAGVRALRAGTSIKSFIDLCGQLRYQIRWADLHRAPKTSVLTHVFFVAALSYLFSLEIGACRVRAYNNFFGGLFHDLPEVLTRDIINPVKRSVEGLRELILEYEKEEMNRVVYPLLEGDFLSDMHLFTEIEDRNRVLVGGEQRYVSVDEINQRWNRDECQPIDGQLIKAADEFNAFIESHEAVRNGASSERFYQAQFSIRSKYEAAGTIGGINMRELFSDFIA